MNKYQQLLQDRAAALARMRSIIDFAESRKRDMTAEEDAEYKALDVSLDKINASIEKERRLLEMESRVGESAFCPAVSGIIPQRMESRDNGGFTNIAELLYAIKEARTGRRDERLDVLREQVETREQTMGTGSQGGFALPTQFLDTMLQAPTQAGVVRPRATVIPAGTPPDAELTIPSLDQTAAENMYGGVIITHGGEGVTLVETDIALRQVSLEPKQMNAYVIVSNKLLRNWQSAGQFVNMQLTKAVGAAEDTDFLKGDGVNKALGIINAPAAIAYNRAAANLIDFPDVYGMLARAKMGGNLCWLASQTVIPELASMVDAGGHAVWLGGQGDALPGAAGGIPSTLMGFPLYFVDRLPTLGTKGDLILADLSYYFVKDGSWSLDLSTELLFLTDRSVFRVIHNVDAKPALTEPLILEGTTASTVSPFVVLDTP